MQGLSRIYDPYFKNVQDGVFALTSDSLKLALLGDTYVPNSTTSARQQNTTYTLGDVAVEYSQFFVAAAATGTSSTGTPDFNVAVGSLVTDGSVVWINYGKAPPSYHEVLADVSSHEVVGIGYTAGGKTVTSVTMALTNRRAVFTLPTQIWSSSAVTAKYAVLYKDATVGTLVKPLIGYMLLDVSGATVTSDNGDFRISFNGGPLFALGA